MTALLIDNLPLLAGAPNGIKKLRELILELAVRGKLVAQDPSDEPASELLKRIDEEKTRLLAAGRIKKKSLLDMAVEEQPFELPSGWEWCKLSGLLPDFQNGASSRGDANGINVTVLRLADIKLGEISLEDTRGLTLEGATVSKHSLEAGDILLIRVNGSADLVGRFIVCRNKLQAIPCDHFIRMRLPKSTVDSDYLKIVSDSAQVRRAIAGLFVSTAGQKTVNQGHIGSLLIPLPPLAQQNRIVAKVHELMALCDRLEAQQASAESAHAQLVQALLGSLTQAADAEDFATSWLRLVEHFHTLFTTESSIDALKQTLLQLAVMGRLVPQDPNDAPASELLKRTAEERALLVAKGKFKKLKPLAKITEAEKTFEIPKSWEWVRLEEIAHVGTGATPLRTNPQYFESATTNWVTSGETAQDFIYETEQMVSSLALKETNLTVYPPHTLIIAMYGQGKTRGQISELLIDACTNQACAAIQLFDKNESHRRYVKYFFVKSYDDIRSLAAGGAQPNLNLGKIKETVLPLPPATEQHRIVTKVDQLMALCDQLKVHLTQARQFNEQLATALVEQAVV